MFAILHVLATFIADLFKSRSRHQLAACTSSSSVSRQ
jgi:hypothetical protein